jgi:hypothetical protein
MSVVQLDPGLYTNVFQVHVPNDPVSIMVASVKNYPDLRPLREEITQNSWKCRVYRGRDRVFGYGEEQNSLEGKSFILQDVHLQNDPDFCKRLILEGLTDHLRNQHYREEFGKGRYILYEPNFYRRAAGHRLRVYRGYNLQSIWWRQESEVSFGVVVDVCWAIQDQEGKRLSPPEIARYGAMQQIAQIQEELLTTGQINTEVARLRLQNHILPFVSRHRRFSLPCGGTATIEQAPIRVILGVQEKK